jgi:O-antigen/teichoic acid export membrane protein
VNACPKPLPRSLSPINGRPESRRLALNFLTLSAGEILAKLLTFAAFFYLARVLGPEGYGGLEFTLAVMMFFTLPADMGLGAYAVREVAKDRRHAQQLFGEITKMRMVLATICFLLLMAFVALVPKSADVKALLAFYGLSLLVGPVLVQWVFQAYDQMHMVAIASILRQGIFAASVFLFWQPHSPLFMLGVFECMAVITVGLFCLISVHRHWGFRLQLPKFRVSRLKTHLRYAVPIGGTELAWAFMWYFATVILGLVFSNDSLGWFGASHRLLMALHTFVWLYFFNLLPSISRCVPLPHQHLRILMGRSVAVCAWTGLFVAFMMTILAREALAIAYGPYFLGASTCFSLLVWMLPIAMLSGHHRYILIAYNHQSSLFRCTVISALVAIFIGCLLVPGFGAVGAAVALLCANATNFFLAYRAVRRRVIEIPVLRELLYPSIVLAISWLVHYLLAALWNAWIAAGISAAVYAAMFLVLQREQFVSLVGLLTRTRSERTVTEPFTA